jgi:hypothetical protein
MPDARLSVPQFPLTMVLLHSTGASEPTILMLNIA